MPPLSRSSLASQYTIPGADTGKICGSCDKPLNCQIQTLSTTGYGLSGGTALDLHRFQHFFMAAFFAVQQSRTAIEGQRNPQERQAGTQKHEDACTGADRIPGI